MDAAARTPDSRGRPSRRRAATRFAAAGLAGLLGLSGVQCVQDLITNSRIPHCEFRITTHTLRLAVGDNVQVPASLTIDSVTINSPIRLSFLRGGAGNGVVRFDSTGRLTALKRGTDTLTVSPNSSALAVDNLVDTLVVQGVASRLTAAPKDTTILSLLAWGRAVLAVRRDEEGRHPGLTYGRRDGTIQRRRHVVRGTRWRAGFGRCASPPAPGLRDRFRDGAPVGPPADVSTESARARLTPQCRRSHYRPADVDTRTHRGHPMGGTSPQNGSPTTPATSWSWTPIPGRRSLD